MLAQSPTQWAAHNRYLEVAAGAHQQNYREIDSSGLTADGTLDTETGNLNAISAALRWQSADGWLVQLQAQRQSGNSQYSGYLQAGNGSLTPYRASTGNQASQVSVDFGYALNASNWAVLPDGVQITPLLHIGHLALASHGHRCGWTLSL